MAHYGSVRHALALGPAPSPAPTENEAREPEGGVETMWRPTPPVTTPDSENAFWNAVYNPTNVEVDGEALRLQVVAEARASMRAELERRKTCPNRLRVEQRLLDQWRRAAVPTINETPRLGRATPDHLQSPFSRF